MNILLSLTNFSSLTGSEIYTYELAKVLVSRGHKVTIMAANGGGIITDKALAAGIELQDFFNVVHDQFDIIHAAQPGPTVYCLAKFPGVPVVCTIHSSLIWERPIVDETIKKYICIRPEIQEKITKDYQIPPFLTTVIYNGVDTSRFNRDFPKSEDGKESILFAGTNDYLREKTVSELVTRTKAEEKTLTVIGEGWDNIKFPEHVVVEKPRWDMEVPTKACTQTASIYLGRTTIEGFCCGKEGLIYDVDEKGQLLSVHKAEVPPESILKQFDIEYMTDKVLEVYKEAINGDQPSQEPL